METLDADSIYLAQYRWSWQMTSEPASQATSSNSSGSRLAGPSSRLAGTSSKSSARSVVLILRRAL